MACFSVLSRTSNRDVKRVCDMISCTISISGSLVNVSLLVSVVIAVECLCYSTDRSATAGRRAEGGIFLTIVKGDMPFVVSRSQTYVLYQSHTTLVFMYLFVATCFGCNCETSSSLL